MSGRAPVRGRGLFVRLFGVCAVVAAVAVAASTWTTVQATAVAEHEQRQQSLHADAVVYDELVGFAATHPSWAGAGPVVERLAARFEHRIVVTDGRGTVLADSEAGSPLPARSQTRAELDPLAVDLAVAAGDGEGDGADQQVVAAPVPTALPAGVLISSSMRIDPRVGSTWTAERKRSVRTDVRAAADRCLGRSAVRRVLDITPRPTALVDSTAGAPARVADCLDVGLREVLRQDTAPPALLLSGDGGRAASVFWDFSGDNRWRIVSAAGAVLLVIVLLCGLLAVQIVRPLRRMAAAARSAGDGDLAVRVSATRHDELGDVARAFNHMADRRQRLEETRAQLMSDISHELRAPLANIRGWLEAAEDGLVTVDRRLVSSLQEETLQLQRLVEDVHQLSLGDVGGLTLDRGDVPVLPFLRQVSDAFLAAAETVGIRILVEADPAAVLVADPVRLRQAVSNLVSNALRHTDPGGTIRLVGDAERIEVVDDGEGIPPHEVEAVFERFRRVDPSRTRQTGGSGLGLAIVRQYMDAEGGTASIRSRPGVGTTVTLAFARAGAPAGPGGDDAPDSPVPHLEPLLRRPR